jgi:hypothetical protein
MTTFSFVGFIIVTIWVFIIINFFKKRKDIDIKDNSVIDNSNSHNCAEERIKELRKDMITHNIGYFEK